MIFAYAVCRKTDFSYNLLAFRHSSPSSRGAPVPKEWQQRTKSANALHLKSAQEASGSKGGANAQYLGLTRPDDGLGGVKPIWAIG